MPSRADNPFVADRYGSAEVRHAICSIIMQRVVGMTHVSREDQRAAYRYALEKMKAEEKEEEEGHEREKNGAET